MRSVWTVARDMHAMSAKKVSFSVGSPSPSKGRLQSQRRSRLALWAETLAHSAATWLREYLLEWQLTDARNSRMLQWRVGALSEAVRHSDVVCFIKPGGLCPFCNTATRLLLAAARATGDAPAHFTLHIADLFNEDREALRVMLGAAVLTWPVVFLGGAHLPGGGEAVLRLHKEGQLLQRACAPRVQFEPHPVYPTVLPRPLLLHQAGGGAWRGCQRRIYGNVLRGIALLQIALLLPAHELQKHGHTYASVPLLALLAIDSLLFCLAGPTPWTPLGNLATMIVWRRRGSVAPLVPYKVTFGALYFALNIGALSCRLAVQGIADDGVLRVEDSNSTAGLGAGTSAAAAAAAATAASASSSSASPVCEVIQSDGLVWSMVTNSIFLAAFRF